ncbi:unnamed protein product [Blepharisma stoltei]|uniref:Uncharacterized protein n=1 Tax=Blepharisma stoltei TaxID=1481888 RepID=A0AAU9IT71_9CILI|nr:unnamed protein product [Blepharisma stoltei]
MRSDSKITEMWSDEEDAKYYDDYIENYKPSAEDCYGSDYGNYENYEDYEDYEHYEDYKDYEDYEDCEYCESEKEICAKYAWALHQEKEALDDGSHSKVCESVMTSENRVNRDGGKDRTEDCIDEVVTREKRIHKKLPARKWRNGKNGGRFDEPLKEEVVNMLRLFEIKNGVFCREIEEIWRNVKEVEKIEEKEEGWRKFVFLKIVEDDGDNWSCNRNK